MGQEIWENPSYKILVDIWDDSLGDADQVETWGYLCYETMCGWYLTSTKEGSDSPKGLRILIKTLEQISNE